MQLCAGTPRRAEAGNRPPEALAYTRNRPVSLAMTSTLRRVVWLACVCALLGASRAQAAGPALAADFDGDGRHDRVTRGAEASVLVVWLSATGTSSVVRSSEPLERVAALDLDGDHHRAELIASGTSQRVHVWTARNAGFHRYRASRLHWPSTLDRPGPRLDDQLPAPAPDDGQPVPPRLSTGFVPPDPVLHNGRRGPRRHEASASWAGVDPFSPRPPPVRIR